MQASALAFAGITSHVALEFTRSGKGLSPGQRLWADWLAWGLLYLLCRIDAQQPTADYAKPEDAEAQPPSQEIRTAAVRPSSFTILACLFVGVQLVGHYAGETMRWATPLLTVTTFAALILSGRAKSASSFFDHEFLQSWQGLLPRDFAPRLTHTLPILVFLTVSIVSSLAFASQPPPAATSALTPGALFLCFATGIYVLLGKLAGSLPSQAGSLNQTYRLALRPLALRVFALWTLYLAVLSPESPKLRFLTLAAGVLRSVQVYAMIILTLDGAGLAATAMTTSAVAITICLGTNTPVSAFTAGLVSIGSLLQTTATLPKSAKNRNLLFILLLLPLVSIMNMRGLIHFGPSPSLSGSSTYGTSHPVQVRVEFGNLQFERLLDSQSKTLKEAVTEYQRRYHRNPPAGFDQWFQIAQENDYLLVDEFDTIMQSMEPFWGISPQTLQARIKAIDGAGDMVHFSVMNGSASWEPDHYHAPMLGEWVEKHRDAGSLPDMDLMINVLDEPRVIAPYDTVELAMHNARMQVERSRQRDRLTKSSIGNADVNWLSVGQQDSWDAMLTSCSVNSPARLEVYDDTFDTAEEGLPFVANVTASKDVCASTDLHHEHGFFQSPESLHITRSLVPILSQCAPTIFNDILYPSPYYAHTMNLDPVTDENDVGWGQKLDRLYWAGTATGGHSRAKTWMGMHRQRLSLMTASDSTMLVSLLRKGAGGLWQPYQSTWAKISEMFHLKITQVVQCEQEACDEMELQFKNEKEPVEASLGSKYVIDIDGNSFSGRYYRLLKSKSCVLKSTIFREWHDDRLVPWVHFIPVSAKAEELGELMRFLVEDEAGQEIGKKIAEQGKSWAEKVLRREDMEIVFFRVLIEYARLVDPRRAELS